MSAAPSQDSSRHIEAIELFADLLAQLEAEQAPDAFYGRLCEGLCELTSMERAVIFRYDAVRGRVVAVGTHGLPLSVVAGANVTPESAPITALALREDRVTEATGPVEEEVPPEYHDILRGRQLVCTPMIAAGRRLGIILSDRTPGPGPLSDEERDLLWTLGKSAALAAMARIATTHGERARSLQHRIDIAREIHDGVIQRLFGVSLALTAEPPLPAEAQARCASEVQHALEELREALQRPLGRPSRPTSVSFAQFAERVIAEYPELGMTVDGADAVPEVLEPLAQAVLGEAVRNAKKHARPTEVRVAVTRGDGVFQLEVANDGVADGRPPHHAASGMGLRLVAFEALQVGGMVEFGPRGAGGWQVRLVVPDDGE